MSQITETDARIELRLETIQKNKILSSIAMQQGINYQTLFTNVYNAIFGEYFLIKFNRNFNPIPHYYVPNAPKKVCVLDYLSSEDLENYLKCVNLVINRVDSTGCSVIKAVRAVAPKAKNMFANLSLLSLQPSIEADVKKQKQLTNGMIKNTKDVKPLKSTQTKNCLRSEPFEQLDAYEMWKNGKEFKCSAFEQVGNYKNGKNKLNNEEEKE